MVEGATLNAFTYDDWGRTATKAQTTSEVTHQATYEYRFGQRLKAFTSDIPGEQTAAYNYDGLGKRRFKLVDGDGTWFRWDAGYNMIAEYDGGTTQTDWDAGNLEMTYIPGLAQVPGTNPSTGDYAYYATDHLGTVRGVYDQSKVLTAALAYTPYGNPNPWRGDTPKKTYTGHYHDAESGMYFAPYRYYMPGAGRWLTRDPLGMVDGPNVYGYVGGAVVRGRDILGLALYICDRKIWGDHANHAYLWSTKGNNGRGQSCGVTGGKGSGSGTSTDASSGGLMTWPDGTPGNPAEDKGPGVDDCRLVSNDECDVECAFDYCKKNANSKPYFPVLRDCHTTANNALRNCGLKPGSPNGRVNFPEVPLSTSPPSCQSYYDYMSSGP